MHGQQEDQDKDRANNSDEHEANCTTRIQGSQQQRVSLERLRHDLAKFASERDWDQVSCLCKTHQGDQRPYVHT